MHQRLSHDSRLLVAGQAVRAFGYGFTAVVLGAMLAGRKIGTLETGVLLALLIAGSAGASLVVGALADRLGRRRCYALFFLAVALAGGVVATDPPIAVLVVVALTGTLSTDVVDNGAATTLEQVMLASEDAGTGHVYGRYNAFGAAFGALGALSAALVGLSRAHAAVPAWLFAVLVPIGLFGAFLAWRLGPGVESGEAPRPVRVRRRRARAVRDLAVLFSVDAAGGGLVTTGFLSYYFTVRYHASLTGVGALFFATSLLQAVAVLIAPILARRFGLVATMVGSHLPSNLLLAAVAFAPTFPVAAAILLVRTTLSQMDVPTRQALVMTVTAPAERTDAAAVTNAARYAVRPVAPLVGGAVQQLGLGAPLLIAGIVKGGYDLALWRWARRANLVTSARAVLAGEHGTTQKEKP